MSKEKRTRVFKTICVTLPPEFYERMEKVQKKEGFTSRSEFYRKIFREYLEKRGM